MDKAMMEPNPYTLPPTPELLAAYADGEFEGREDLQPLRRELEAWIADRPEVQMELAELRRLRRLVVETPPPEPSDAHWTRCLDAIAKADKTVSRPADPAAKILGTIASLAAVVMLFFVAPQFSPRRTEVWATAGPKDVEIVQGEADDWVQVAWQVPHNPLPLAESGDVVFVEPEMPRRVVYREGVGRPMIWALAEEER
jgi:anti-sigma factor RsiW